VGQGVGYGGGAAGYLEFGEDVLDMVLGGAPADVQGLADGGVGGAVGEQLQYFQFACGEGGAVWIGGGALAWGAGAGLGAGSQCGYAGWVEAVVVGEVGWALAGPYPSAPGCSPPPTSGGAARRVRRRRLPGLPSGRQRDPGAVPGLRSGHGSDYHIVTGK